MIVILLWLALQAGDPDQATIDRIMGVAAVRGYDQAAKLLVSEYQLEPYQFGVTLAQSCQMPKRSELWFRGLLKDTGENDTYRFGLAWALWLQRDVKNALNTVGPIIQSKDLLIRARALSLVGQIHSSLGEHQKALEFFGQSVEAYRRQKKYGGEYTNLIYQAKELGDLGRFIEARTLIDQAEAANIRQIEESHLPPKPPSQLLTARFNLSYQQRAYRDAKNWAEQAIKYYEEERNYAGAALRTVYVGLCQALLGELEAAQATATAVDEGLGYPTVPAYVLVYNNLTWFVINRCRGFDVKPYEREIENWVKEHDEPLLAQMLSEVRTEPCPNP